MGNVSDKFVEKITAHILCSFFSENHAVYVIKCRKNMVEPDRSQGMI